MPRELTPAEQVALFNSDWQASNATLNGQHDPAKAPGVAQEAPKQPKPPREPRTKAEKLLKSVSGLASPFSLAQLVINAAEEWPDDFCFAPACPSDNAVKCVLYGARGIIARKLIRKREDGLFEAVPEGRNSRA